MNYPRIRELREENEVKQKVIADYLHIAQNTYSQYENGRREIPIEIFSKLADYYRTTIDYLANRVDQR